MRGRGPANVGVPQGSPLSPVVFLICMAPILEKIEKRMREEVGRSQGAVDVEVPSFVDDMSMDVINWEGNANMQAAEANVKKIVREVAEECRLPLEVDKETTLHLRKSRKKRKADRKYVKWLGVIFDGSLDINMHGKSRHDPVYRDVGCRVRMEGPEELGARIQQAAISSPQEGNRDSARNIGGEGEPDGGGGEHRHAYGQQPGSVGGQVCGGPLQAG